MRIIGHGDYIPTARVACYRSEYIVSTYLYNWMLWDGTILFLIVIVNMEWCYRIYLSRLGVSDMDRICWIWFLSFLLSYLQFVSLQECGSRWIWLENLQFSNCLLATLVRILDLDSELGYSTRTHICGFCRLLDIYIKNY